MLGEQGEPGQNPFAIEPEGDYGTLNPRFLAQSSNDLEKLRITFPTDDSPEAEVTRLASVRTDLADLSADAIRGAKEHVPDEEDNLLMTMALDTLIDPDK